MLGKEVARTKAIAVATFFPGYKVDGTVQQFISAEYEGTNYS